MKMFFYRPLLYFIFLFTILSTLHAQEVIVPQEPTDTSLLWDHQPETQTFQSKFLNMLVILGLLIGFMLLASWSLKRMMRSKVDQLNVGNAIKVLESRHLSQRVTIHLIEIEDKKYVIAESPTAVTSLIAKE
jgi:flagellar biogenesis protein FliO